MKLIELLEVFNENNYVWLYGYDEDGVREELGRYDGKDSIDECYNDCNVTFISVRDFGWERRIMGIAVDIDVEVRT